MKLALIIAISVFSIWMLSGIVFSYFDSHREKKQAIEIKLLIETALLYLNDRKSELESSFGKWHSGDYVWIADETRMMTEDDLEIKREAIRNELKRVSQLIKQFIAIQEGYNDET